LINTPEAWLKTHDELQSVLFHIVICIKLRCNMTQITVYNDANHSLK